MKKKVEWIKGTGLSKNLSTEKEVVVRIKLEDSFSEGLPQKHIVLSVRCNHRLLLRCLVKTVDAQDAEDIAVSWWQRLGGKGFAEQITNSLFEITKLPIETESLCKLGVW